MSTSVVSSLVRSQTADSGLVHLRLLGCFRLEVDDAVIPLPLGTQRLLALLGLRGSLSRPRLAGTLWPDTSQTQALTNLRHVFWRLQCAIPQRVVVVAAGVELALAADVDCDVARLEREARRLWAGDSVVSLVEAPAPGTPGLSPGSVEDLLPDWDDEWVLGDRERLRQLHLHALEAYAEALLAAGQFGLALHFALTALSADVLRESAHRTVIKVHRAEGNISEARRALDRCRAILENDLGVAPTAETLALVP